VCVVSEEDIEEEMEAEVKVLMEDVDEELFELLGMKATLISTELVDKGTLDGVHVLWNNPYLSNRDFTATVNTDLMWAAASLMAVATYIAIHTRSLMFALLGMLQVIFSFVLAIFVCKLIFQVLPIRICAPVLKLRHLFSETACSFFSLHGIMDGVSCF
jgi:hypothetical protein